jgi:hypothetical protein
MVNSCRRVVRHWMRKTSATIISVIGIRRVRPNEKGVRQVSMSVRSSGLGPSKRSAASAEVSQCAVIRPFSIREEKEASRRPASLSAAACRFAQVRWDSLGICSVYSRCMRTSRLIVVLLRTLFHVASVRSMDLHAFAHTALEIASLPRTIQPELARVDAAP